MQKIIRHKNHNDRGIVSPRRVLAVLHHFPRRVCRDSSEFLTRQLSLHLRVDAMIVRDVAGVIGEPFSTHDMASLLGAEEYQVRAAIGWLIKKERRLEPCKGCRNDNSYMVFGKRMHGCAIGRRRPNDKCYEDAVSMTCAGGK